MRGGVDARKPREWLASGEWPHGPLDPAAPVAAIAAKNLALALDDAIQADGWTQRSLADASGVAHTTIGRILNGQVLCDIGTLAALEEVTGRVLWARCH